MSEHELLRSLSRSMRQRMVALKIDLRQLSDMTGLSLGSLSAVWNAKGNPTIKTVSRICNALDISPATLLGGGQA